MNSEHSRRFNAWLNSEEFNGASLRSYLMQLQQMNVIQADYKGFAIWLNLNDKRAYTWSRLPLLELEADWSLSPQDYDDHM